MNEIPGVSDGRVSSAVFNIDTIVVQCSVEAIFYDVGQVISEHECQYPASKLGSKDNQDQDNVLQNGGGWVVCELVTLDLASNVLYQTTQVGALLWRVCTTFTRQQLYQAGLPTLQFSHGGFRLQTCSPYLTPHSFIDARDILATFNQ